MSHIENKVSLTGIIVWGICALFFTYEFLLRTVLGTFEHPLMYDLHLDLVSFAILSSTAYQTVYGLMQIPVGIITDRMGLKKTLFIATLICAIAVLGFGLTHEFKSAFLFRVLMGFGSSFGFIGLLVAVYDWMPRKKIAFFIGLSQFLGTLGPMIAAGPLNTIAQGTSVDWRLVFYCLAALGGIIAIFIALFVKNNKDYAGSFQILKPSKPLAETLFALIKQPQVWVIAIFSASIYFTIEYLSENSGKTFLMLRGVSSDTASYMITIAWLGYAIGCPVLGYISDLTGRRKSMMVSAAFLCLIAGIAIIYLPTTPILLITAFLLLGIGASGQSIGFAIMAEQCSENYLAAGLGFNNAVIMLVASINAPLIGWLISTHMTGEHATVGDYQYGFWLILAFMGLALILALFFIQETFCKSTKETTKLAV